MFDQRSLPAAAFILAVVGGGLVGRAAEDERQFFVYRDSDFAENHGFWTNFMPDGKAAKLLVLKLADKEDPYSGASCIRIDAKGWHDQGWQGVAVACKRDYWGDKPFAKAFDLRAMRQLVFYAKGNVGGESIQVQALTTGDQKYGDSSKSPVESEWIKLDKTWKRYAIDLRGADLERVVIPFAVFVDESHNEGPEVTFFLDHVHYTDAPIEARKE